MQFPLSPLWTIASHLFSFWKQPSTLWLHRMWIFPISSFSILQDSVSESRHSSVFLLLVHHFLFPFCPHHNFIFYYSFGLMKIQLCNINSSLKVWDCQNNEKPLEKSFAKYSDENKEFCSSTIDHSTHELFQVRKMCHSFSHELLRWLQFIPELSPNDFSRTARLWGFNFHASETRLWTSLGGTIKVLPKKKYIISLKWVW